ncbi:TonB-dependent receptor [Sphingomonas sp. 1P06PA]|uniref:TonB-dependent receptor n=1 Tax=Sphingomonas sp. 1P06PA TaxID=554121 RepID=UPI0039A65AA7
MKTPRIGLIRLVFLTGAAALPMMTATAMAQSSAAPETPLPANSAAGDAAPDSAASAAATPAQTAPAQTGAGNPDGDIVVTAQRREERLSRVPVSVSAFSAEALQTKVIQSEQDVGTLVPGLQVKNGQTSNQLSFSLRGQTLDPFSGTSPAVLTYLNEAPYLPYNTATSFFDLASVQVLKGPQGTLFGRNATGGAVLYTTPTPGNEIGGNLLVRAGQRNSVQVQGAIDLPVIKDLLLVRVAGDYTKEDGFIRNLYTGNTLGDKDNVSGRLTVLFMPTEGIKNTTVAQYAKFLGTEGQGNLFNYYTSPNAAGQQFINNGRTSILNTNGTPLTSTLDTVYNVFSGLLFNRDGNNLGDSNLTPGPAIGPGRFPGGVAGYAAFSRANPYDIYLEFDLPHRSELTFISNTTEFDISEALLIKNIFSYTRSTTKLPGNLAGGPFGALWLYNDVDSVTSAPGDGPPGGQTFRATTFSNELQAQGDLLDGNLHYTVGGFYTSFKHFDNIPVHVGAEIDPNAGAAAAFGLPADISYTYNSKNYSTAVFGQFDYKLTDRLTFTAGGRYTWEKVRLSQAPGSIFALSGVQPVGVEQRRSLSDPSWTFNLRFQADERNMFYVAQRGSFRSGNFNGTVLPLNDANFFKNETTKDYEIGYKYSGRVAGAPFRFSIAAYQQDVKNAQHAVYAVVGGNPAGFTLNVPEARTRGVEVEASVSPARGFDFSITGAYTDAKYTDGVVDIARLTGVPGSTILFDSYPDTPKFAGTFSADFTLPISEDVGRVVLHGDVYMQSDFFFSNNNGSVTPGTELDGYTNTNLRLSWNDIFQSNFSAAIYAKNVFDNLYYVSGYALGAAGGYNTAYPGQPRTVMGEISFKF